MQNQNLLAQEATLLAEESELLEKLDRFDPVDLVKEFPKSSLLWSMLARDALNEGLEIEGYAFARVGYHRGLDALRAAGWRGQGPVPYAHEPNRGVLRCLYLLRTAASLIGETEEVARLTAFLNDADKTAINLLEKEFNN